MKHASLKQYVSLRQSLIAEKTKLEARLHAINQALGGSLKTSGAPVKKKFSAAARARIAAAQRARWARIKAAKKQGK
jgi:hypothetical protein